MHKHGTTRWIPALAGLLFLLAFAAPALAADRVVVLATQPPAAAVTAAPETAAPAAAPEAALEEEALLPTPAATPAPVSRRTPAPDTDPSVLTLSFIGDCSIGDSLSARGQTSSLTSVIRDNGYAWAFDTSREWLEADDCTFANLEVVLTEQTRGRKNKSLILIAPPEYARVLAEGGVEVVNTVNNHCMDFTGAGYNDTLAALEEAGVRFFGSVNYKKHPEWDITAVCEVRGCRIGLIGLSYPQNYDLPLVEQHIRELRADGCSLVFVSLHWGRETHLTPNAGQYAYAETILDLGADAIWGHHPHVLQPVCFYKGKPILFSTGNFIFGTMSNVDPYTGIFQLHYEPGADGSPRLARLSVVPMRTRHKDGEYRPYLLTDPEEIETCYSRLVAAKPGKGATALPADFVKTGEVWVLADGSLSALPPEETGPAAPAAGN